MPPVALITGITGQDGSLLAEFLLGKGYEVHGLVRRVSHQRPAWVDGVLRRVHRCHEGDLTDTARVWAVVDQVASAALERGNGRAEVYNLAAQSHVGYSFLCPSLTWRTNHLAVIDLLAALRDAAERRGVDWRVCQASTSEMFGATPPPQSETSAFVPVSPYGASKLGAHQFVQSARLRGMFACSVIGFNHESARRGPDFVTSKIVRAARMLDEKRPAPPTRLGSLDARRDWGYAGDHVRAMWHVMQLDAPDDFVVATGVQHSVRDFAQRTLEMCCGARLEWVTGPDGREEGVATTPAGETVTVFTVDPTLLRPVEVPALCGDAAKLRAMTTWKPEVQTLDHLIRLMTENPATATTTAATTAATAATTGSPRSPGSI
jgi:GDPmannose 4,6-dehydratase